MSIDENIREYRKKAGLSQKELGKRLGVSQQHIAQYENGKRTPKRETLKKIADALNVPLYKLMGFDGSIRVNIDPEIIKQDAEVKELLKKHASGGNITEEERRKISDYVKHTRESLSHFLESVKGMRDMAEEWNENILLSDYRKLNDIGQAEARKRVNELTEIPRYTKADAPPQE